MKKGFSLVEVLVFVTILSLFFVAAMAVATYSLKTIKTNQYKILATHFAEEGVEWLRGQKEDGWSVFTALDPSPGSSIYCISSLDFSSPGECGESYALGTPQIFKREVVLENIPDSSDSDQVNVRVMVVWSGGVKVELKTVFKQLE